MTDAEIAARHRMHFAAQHGRLLYRRDFVCPVCQRAYQLDRAVRRAQVRLCQRCKGRQ